MTTDRGTTVRQLAVLGGLNLRRIARDRIGVFVLVALPCLIVLVTGLATSNSAALRVGLTAPGPLGASLSTHLASSDIEVVSFDSRDELQRAIRKGDVPAGLAVPPTAEATLAGGGRVDVELLDNPELGRTAGLLPALAAAVAAESARYDLARANPAGDPDQLLASGSEVLRERVRGTHTAFGFEARGTLVLFTLIAGIVCASQLIESLESRTWQRILVGPVPRTTALAGAFLDRFVIAVVQAGIMVGLSAWLFDIDWGMPAHVALVVGTLALVTAGIGAAVATFCRTASQPVSVGPPAGFLLAAAGGCIWSLDRMSDGLRAIGHLTPNAWAMDALANAAAGAGTAAVVLPLVPLLALAAVCFAVASHRLVTWSAA